MNHANSLTGWSVGQLNAENTLFIYSDIVLPDGETICPCAKYPTFSSMSDFLEKDIKFPKCSCVLNCCSGFPRVFF